MWDFSRPPPPSSKWWKVTGEQQARQVRIAEGVRPSPSRDKKPGRRTHPRQQPDTRAADSEIFVFLRPYENQLLEWLAKTHPHIHRGAARATLIAERDFPGVWARFLVENRQKPDQ
jgi:hypothetical protein